MLKKYFIFFYLIITTNILAVYPSLDKVTFNGNGIWNEGDGYAYTNYDGNSNFKYTYLTNTAISDNDMLLIVIWNYKSEYVSNVAVNQYAAEFVTRCTDNDQWQEINIYKYYNPPDNFNYVGVTLNATGYFGFEIFYYNNVSTVISNIVTDARPNTYYSGITITANSSNSRIITFACTRGNSSVTPLGGNRLQRYNYPNTSDRDFFAMEVTSVAQSQNYFCFVTSTGQVAAIAQVTLELEPVGGNTYTSYPVYKRVTTLDKKITAAYSLENSGADITGHGYDLIIVGNPFTTEKSLDGSYSIKPNSSNYVKLPTSLISELYNDYESNTSAQYTITFYCWNEDMVSPQIMRTESDNWRVSYFWSSTDHRFAIWFINNWYYVLNYTKDAAYDWQVIQVQVDRTKGIWSGIYYFNGAYGYREYTSNPLSNAYDSILIGAYSTGNFYIDHIEISRNIARNGKPAEWLELKHNNKGDYTTNGDDIW